MTPVTENPRSPRSLCRGWTAHPSLQRNRQFVTQFSHGAARFFSNAKSETPVRFRFPEKLWFCVPQHLGTLGCAFPTLFQFTVASREALRQN
jgi:hypothetical protein